MQDPAALLQEVVCRQQIFGIIVLDHFQRTVLAILSVSALRDSVGHLKISVVGLQVTEDEVTFQRSDPSHTDTVSSAFRVEIRNVLQHGAIVDAVVRVVTEIKAQIGEIVFFLALQRSFGLHIEAVTFVENLGVYENGNILA